MAAADVQTRTVINDLLRPDSQPTFNFGFSNFLEREYRFGLDPQRPQCKAYLQGHCPNGKSCPDKHQATSSYNNLVCKHWLRGLCKKGDACEFLHEYNLRRMPECSYYSRHLTCSNGDDCLYLHIDPESRRSLCPHYERGFCPLGPRCANRHVKKGKLCPFYLAGFCPNGKACQDGVHVRFPEDLKKPEVKVEKSREELDRERAEREMEREREEQEQREREERQGFGSGQKFRGQWQGGRSKRSDRRKRRQGY